MSEIHDPPTQSFDCADCGARVIRYSPPTGAPTRCLRCEFVAEIADPAERATVRRRLFTERAAC